MGGTSQDPNLKQVRPDEPELDLYTIPSHSCWFSWDDIHETERVALKEFFDGSSITRTPKIYKEYRDFIINKYREDPSRRLTFSEVRKSLVGDVSLLQKVFLLLEKWGLINFSAPSGGNNLTMDNEDTHKVKLEEGAPNGVRVVAMPNSLKPISVPPKVGHRRGDMVESVVKLPPLTSYLDVFPELTKKQNVLVCGNCGERCDSGCYQHTQGNFTICAKCFKNGNYGENKSMDDFKFNDCHGNSGSSGAVWTEAETLLLLESVLKHGEDWELVAQNVPTKTKLDCIAKLIELPFGELMMSSIRGSSAGSTENISSTKQALLSSSAHPENIKMEDPDHKQINMSEKNGDSLIEEPPSKRKRTASLSDSGSSLMKQVALISSMVGPHITAVSADAAVVALCKETSCPREIFDGKEDYITNGFTSPTLLDEPERAEEIEDSQIAERPAQSETQEATLEKNDVPLTLRIRAAVATALGAAASHAKLLANQEDREIENLVATIIETQLEKLHSKMKHFENLELIMEKESTEIEELQEHVLGEWISLLQGAFSAGISKRWDHTYAKS